MATNILILDWFERYRGYMLEASHELGLNLHFILSEPTEYDALSSHAKDIWVLPRLNDNPLQWTDDIVAYARDHQIDAILTNEDDLEELAAWVCKRMGLPGPSPESVHLAHDKWATREKLSRMGLPGPQYQLVTSLPEARAAIDTIGLPAVMKPIGCSGGIGASRLTSIDGLSVAWKKAYDACLMAPDDYHKIIIEEFMPGPLVSVEAAVIEGVPTAVVVTDCPQFEVADGESCFRFIPKGAVLPSTFDDATTQELKLLTEKTIQALGIETGIVHTELKCTPQGGKIVEVNPRLPGVFVPELVHRALGINWAKVAMLLALGHKPDLTIQQRKGTCLQLFVPRMEGTIEKIAGFEDMITAPHVVRARLWVAEGDHVVSPRENVQARLGYVLTEHENSHEALLAAQKAEDLLAITLQRNAVLP
jgi:biotin carboxylase